MVDIRPEKLAVLEDHLEAESNHDLDALLEGFTADCFNDVACMPKRFVGPKRVGERYRKHWEGFPDFKVRIRRILAADENAIVTENQWTGTHLGPFQGIPPTGRRVRVRSLVVWHFRGDELWGETVFFDVGSILKQIGAEIVVRPGPGPGRKSGGKSGGKPGRKPRAGKAARAAAAIVLGVALAMGAGVGATPAGAIELNPFSAIKGAVEAAVEDRSSDDIAADLKIKAAIVADVIDKMGSDVISISADVYEQDVMLTGAVEKAALKQQAGALTRAVEGVKKIYNEILVIKPIDKEKGTVENFVDDTVIESKINALLLDAGGVNVTNFRWRSVGGKVFLFGRALSSDERDKAVQVVKEIKNVTSVTSRVKVRPKG